MTMFSVQGGNETAIRAGASWKGIVGNAEIPDQFITRILSFLGSTVEGDLVHTNYSGGGGLFDEMEDLVEQMVLVGADGAGRHLRRRRFDVPSGELLRDVDAIYLCEARIEGLQVRYVVVDVQLSSNDSHGAPDATLVCRRDQFQAVHLHLQMGGSGGTIWRGSAIEEKDPVLALDPEDYVFDPDLIDRLKRETVSFLSGEVATKLREWGTAAKTGIMLHGEPGNGKTVLTRLCAKFALEAGMDVVIIEGRRRSRQTFDRGIMGLGDELRRGAARSPVLLIFEDIDLHCQKRTSSGPDQAEQPQPLAELLDFLDGVEPTQGYVLIASTNDKDRLDGALVRPGRIDSTIEVKSPDITQRTELLGRLIGRGPEPAPDPADAAELLDGSSFAGVAEVARRYKIAAAYEARRDLQELLEEAASGFMEERKADNGD